jgi:germination protein M
MSRTRKGSRAPRIAIVVLAAVVVVLGAVLVRIYPDYQRLRAGQVNSGRASQESPSAEEPHPIVARLYFARIVEGKQRMVAISRELPAGLGPARAALAELIRGEVPRGCERPLPLGTTVRSIRVADGVAIVDFSEELITGFRGGSDNEGVTVYSIVNTLTSLPGVKKVRLLVGGEKVNTVGGHLDVSVPLAYERELVVPYP